jgi:hypothetical protein
MKVFSFATSKTAKIMELEVQGGSLNNSSAAINSAHSLNSSSYNSKDTVEEEHAATKEEYVELFLATLFALNYRRQQRSEPQAKKGKIHAQLTELNLTQLSLQPNRCNIKWCSRSTRKKCQK